jgi:hypothetical protein
MEKLHHARSLARLRWRLAAGIAGLILVSCLTARPMVAATDDESFFTHLHTEKAMANVTVSPGRAGPVDITIQLETVDELPLTAKAVSVTLSNQQLGIGRQTLQAARTSDGQWRVKASMLAPGRWMLGLGISISDTDKVEIESPILIR